MELAARFLPLVARESRWEYDAWALRWLARWPRESAGSIERSAEIAAALADLPAEPSFPAEFLAAADLLGPSESDSTWRREARSGTH
ncbi:MAG: hypothetical protein QOI03_1312 [Solirubrobacteraceae bacterium]|nr:hypothetical protein [Solirubrobacteraceae bacterium]